MAVAVAVGMAVTRVTVGGIGAVAVGVLWSQAVKSSISANKVMIVGRTVWDISVS